MKYIGQRNSNTRYIYSNNDSILRDNYDFENNKGIWYRRNNIEVEFFYDYYNSVYNLYSNVLDFIKYDYDISICEKLEIELKLIIEDFCKKNEIPNLQSLFYKFMENTNFDNFCKKIGLVNDKKINKFSDLNLYKELIIDNLYYNSNYFDKLYRFLMKYIEYDYNIANCKKTEIELKVIIDHYVNKNKNLEFIDFLIKFMENTDFDVFCKKIGLVNDKKINKFSDLTLYQEQIINDLFYSRVYFNMLLNRVMKYIEYDYDDISKCDKAEINLKVIIVYFCLKNENLEFIDFFIKFMENTNFDNFCKKIGLVNDKKINKFSDLTLYQKRIIGKL